MRHTGYKIALHLIQTVLLVPINKDHVDPGENQEHQKTAFKQNQPLNFGSKQIRAYFLSKLLDSQVIFKIPIDPDRHENDPGNLNPDKHHDRMKQVSQSAHLPLPSTSDNLLFFNTLSISTTDLKGYYHYSPELQKSTTPEGILHKFYKRFDHFRIP